MTLKRFLYQGQVLGELYDGTVPGVEGGGGFLWDGCGVSGGPHVHFKLPTQAVSIDGWSSNGTAEWTNGAGLKKKEGDRFPSTNDSDAVLIFEHEMVRMSDSPFKTLRLGDYNLDDFDNKVSSILIPDGWFVVVYEKYDKQGGAKLFDESVADLRSYSFDIVLQVMFFPPSLGNYANYQRKGRENLYL